MDILLLKEGLFVMVIGMGTVFMFLGIMIAMMNLNSMVLKNFVNKLFPETVVELTPKKNNSEEEEIALALACAYAKYREV